MLGVIFSIICLTVGPPDMLIHYQKWRAGLQLSSVYGTKDSTSFHLLLTQLFSSTVKMTDEQLTFWDRCFTWEYFRFPFLTILCFSLRSKTFHAFFLPCSILQRARSHVLWEHGMWVIEHNHTLWPDVSAPLWIENISNYDFPEIQFKIGNQSWSQLSSLKSDVHQPRLCRVTVSQ